MKLKEFMEMLLNFELDKTVDFELVTYGPSGKSFELGLALKSVERGPEKTIVIKLEESVIKNG